jgi:prophage regulatory protein
MPRIRYQGGDDSMPEPNRIIRLKTVLARTGLSRATIYRKIKSRTFPAQVKITVNGAGWHESEVDRWVADPAGWRPKEVERSALADGLRLTNL